ncbi:MAG: class I SAM-dependent methyltransferase [Desulfobulbaceae bacterium]|nr:class I SAM-dependent methyltransferase [Desulfobulbaceae bacterium]
MGYNENLFGTGLRGKLHFARFHWLNNSIQNLNLEYESVIELGCYDGKTIDFLPNKDVRYLGLDANWDSGLDIAEEKFRHSTHNYKFLQSFSPNDATIARDEFDISICMETLEHVPTASVDAYLEMLSHATNKMAFISVPNEIGMVFFFKHLVKLAMGHSRNYTFSEFCHQCLGKTEMVSNPGGKGGHRGFSYKKFILQVSDHFEIISVSGIPFSKLPLAMNFGVGIVGRPKQ